MGWSHAPVAERIARHTIGYDFTTPIVHGSHCLLTDLAGYKGGYPTIYHEGRRRVVSHVVWEQSTATKLEPGQQVLHHCDNPACIEFRHFFLGDNELNHIDKCAKGRQAKGEGHGRRKLSLAEVIAIRADTRFSRLVASDFGVTRRTVDRIRRGELWKAL